MDAFMATINSMGPAIAQMVGELLWFGVVVVLALIAVEFVKRIARSV